MTTRYEVVLTAPDGLQMLLAVRDRIVWSRRHTQRIAADCRRDPKFYDYIIEVREA